MIKHLKEMKLAFADRTLNPVSQAFPLLPCGVDEGDITDICK